MTQTAAVKKQGILRRFLHSDEVSVSIPLLAIILITTLFRRDFLTVKNFSAMFTQIPFIAICALGASFTLMTGNVDISTGRVAGFAGIFMAMLCVDYGWEPGPAILIALLIAVAIGLFNGFLVVYMKVPDFVATMGTLYMVGGARYLCIKGYELTMGKTKASALIGFFDKRLLGMPPYFWIMLALFAVVLVIIKKTLWGRRLLACGDNREVAALAGINVRRKRMTAYALAALFSAIAGILLTLDLGIGKPETGDGWEFRAIAGCVVGGVSLSGGKGSPLGVLIGVTLVFVAENAIIFLGMPTTMRIAIQGALMAGAVLFDIFRQKRKVPA